MERLAGKSVYEGVVIGETYLDIDTNLQNEKENITFEEIEKEKIRLEQGIENTIFDLKTLKKDLKGKLNEKELGVIEAHILLLEDPMYISDIKNLIVKKEKKAEFAVKETTEKFIKLFENIVY